MSIKVKYVGEGFLSGIPARDLSEEEWAALSKEEQKLAISSGLYEVIKPAGKKAEKEGE